MSIRYPSNAARTEEDRQVNELLHVAAYFLNHAPRFDDADHGEV
jgi:hypothetical protein